MTSRGTRDWYKVRYHVHDFYRRPKNLVARLHSRVLVPRSTTSSLNPATSSNTISRRLDFSSMHAPPKVFHSRHRSSYFMLYLVHSPEERAASVASAYPSGSCGSRVRGASYFPRAMSMREKLHPANMLAQSWPSWPAL